MTSNTIDILLVEDNQGDVDLALDCLESFEVSSRIRVAMDGAEALTFLQRSCDPDNDEAPDIIILDLNIPKKNGRQVLADLKRHPVLKRIPVVVLTSSNAESDIAACYELGANCYVRKPAGWTTTKARCKRSWDSGGSSPR